MTIYFVQNGFKIEHPESELERQLSKAPYLFLYNEALNKTNIEFGEEILYLLSIANLFFDELGHNGEIEVTRKFKEASVETYQKIANQVPFVKGSEYVNSQWVRRIYLSIGELFNEEMSQIEGSIEDYLLAKNKQLQLASRVYFHLVESKDEAFPFLFLATYAEGNSKKVNHLPLKNALSELDSSTNMLTLLGAVSKVSDISSFISRLVESGELFHPLKFTSQEAYQFLTETSIYENCGIICRIPDFWKKENGRRVSLSVGNDHPSKLGLDSLISCQPKLMIEGEVFTKLEIEALLRETEGLSFLKGKWIEINHQKLKDLLVSYENLSDMDLSLLDFIKMDESLVINEEVIPVELEVGSWLSDFRRKLVNGTDISTIPVDKSFKANLRAYQQDGLNWLSFMMKHQLGALLADDMGLGKTIQILALINQMRLTGLKTLLIVPASLLDNWGKEAKVFTPDLRLKKMYQSKEVFELSEADAFITTYGMVSKIEQLMETPFDLIVLDEAQVIKNPKTKQTKNIKQLISKNRIALTGTPIENNISDLWSIYDFLNPGLLGTHKDFTSFIKQKKEYEKVRKMISPFMLRRLKTDKRIISDLPNKYEHREYIGLSNKQIVLYKQLQKSVQQAVEESEGIKKKGIVLSAITKFKQICNHPDQYLGNQAYKEKQSGKFEYLKSIAETISEKHEKMIVFTQFKEMCEPLNDFLSDVFGSEGLVLNGSTPVKKRSDLVAQFNDEANYIPYMILSLKAGGVGLNLTSANHVIHFDRWWNPATENQATDRAFRIGQEKHVFVYKFITRGTIEEKIDEMLAEKVALSETIITVSANENWLMSMSDSELQQLFSLEVD
ncbi:DEAD/DEAH box helicase [Candidatus Vagococcus giribetii]